VTAVTDFEIRNEESEAPDRDDLAEGYGWTAGNSIAARRGVRIARLSEVLPYSQEQIPYGNSGQSHNEGQGEVLHHLRSSALRSASVMRIRPPPSESLRSLIPVAERRRSLMRPAGGRCGLFLLLGLQLLHRIYQRVQDNTDIST
jgi:hypothetical protein